MLNRQPPAADLDDEAVSSNSADAICRIVT